MNYTSTLVANPLTPRKELPGSDVATPCFVVFENGVLHNLEKTTRACGGPGRLMPHLKTHRAPWIVKLLLQHGVQAFKAATIAEVEMALVAGARYVVWAYPSLNSAHIKSFVALARQFREARLDGMIDSQAGVARWSPELKGAPENIRIRVDLDPGLGRTGALMPEPALTLAKELCRLQRFVGWHLYDGHVKGPREERERQITELAASLSELIRLAESEPNDTDVVAGGSYTFNLWPGSIVRYVSPGSWTYSSDQHDKELADLGWTPSAFVLTTVISTRAGTATLDAGSKAISPDKPLAERFRWPGRILLMNEEHTVVEARNLIAGDRLLLLPRHACTTAYLYNQALVKTASGRWEYRDQLGNRR